MAADTENKPRCLIVLQFLQSFRKTAWKKLRDFERELNKQGYWNIALVAYQIKE